MQKRLGTLASQLRQSKTGMGESAAEALRKRLDNSLLRELDADPQEQSFFPNKETRPVQTGHYVRIQPTPLKKPHLITYSEDMAERLGLTPEQVHSESFLRIFSANLSDPEQPNDQTLEAWCTPYAVSVYGMPIADPCQFRGYAYGDGRACSIGEFTGTRSGERWELQLKGCGPTPFARSFDGRAVLRSSIREFIASEAMHCLRVPTTRALSLVGSVDEVPRPWYKPNVVSKEYDFPPNHMIRETCAITCRCASSFLRVGQVELYQRRLANGDANALAGMKKFVAYCIRREFPTLKIGESESEFRSAIIEMLREFGRRQAHLVQQWIRVGYTQGNMNSDNCLLAGLTMDYGPFGFVERYSPLWTPFTSDPDRKFGFERQPMATHVNLATLTEAVLPLLEGEASFVDQAMAIVKEEFPAMVLEERNEMRRSKLGLRSWKEGLDTRLWEPLYKVLQGIDYTIFWRELAKFSPSAARKDEILSFVKPALYEELSEEKRDVLTSWLEEYAKVLEEDGVGELERVELMNKSNPKYIPREWMLVQAYEAAKNDDFGPIETLKQVLSRPYDEQPDMESSFFRVTPPEYQRRAGVSFFSCSS